MAEQSKFKTEVIRTVKQIPKGKVMSYGQIAAVAGSPRAARQVGGILRGYDGTDSLPWWRVVNSEGYLSIKGNFIATKDRQKQLLLEEGIDVSKDYKVDIHKLRYVSK